MVLVHGDLRVSAVTGWSTSQVTSQALEVLGAIHAVTHSLSPDMQCTIIILHSNFFDASQEHIHGIVSVRMEDAER